MRLALILLLLLTGACGQSNTSDDNNRAGGVPSVVVEAHWSGAGRDRLCMKNERTGFITYAAAGDSNCTVSGSAERVGDTFRVKPDGDPSCVIDLRRDGQGFVLGSETPACAFYCGPNASFAGKRFAMKANSSKAVDLAGDPLC